MTMEIKEALQACIGALRWAYYHPDTPPQLKMRLGLAANKGEAALDMKVSGPRAAIKE